MGEVCLKPMFEEKFLPGLAAYIHEADIEMIKAAFRRNAPGLKQSPSRHSRTQLAYCE